MHDVYMSVGMHAEVRGQFGGAGLLVLPLGGFWVSTLIWLACIVNSLTGQAILLALG